MKKNILQKKIDLMKSIEGCQEAKSGSLYIVLQESKQKITKKFNEYIVTKNTLHNLGTTRTFTKTARTMVLLTKGGKLMVKGLGEPRFTPATIKRLRLNAPQSKPVVYDIFFTGKQYEWVKDYPDLWNYRFFTGFNSLREAKVHLGFGFVNDKEFLRVFKANHKLVFNCKDHNSRVNAVQLTSSDNYDPLYVDEYTNMCEQNGSEVVIPAGWNKLIELHDAEVIKAAEKEIDSISNDNYTYESDIFEDWEGLTYEVLDTPRKVFIEGKRQQHCLHSYHNRLGTYMFVRFEFEGKQYHAQYGQGGTLQQLYGYKNTSAPIELRDRVINNNKHQIKITHEKAISLDSDFGDTPNVYVPEPVYDAVPF